MGVNDRATGIVFLSGGSALQSMARHLAADGHQATHVISVFDSGGSAGRLRQACDGIAIGDIRKRLTAIGDGNAPAASALVNLFAARLPSNESIATVRRLVEQAAEGEGELLTGLHNGASLEIADAFASLLESMPADFDWCDGSVGNLILCGRYLRAGNWASALEWAHGRLETCGQVMPVSTSGAHLGARLTNGEHVVGQAAITDEKNPIRSPVAELYLADDSRSGAHTVKPDPRALAEIREARAIVYAWGSFYTSVLPSLLVDGVADAIRERDVPKALLLNPVRDSETRGRSATDLVREVRKYGGGDAALTHVVALRLPNGNSLYQPTDRTEIEALGVEVIEVRSPGIPGVAQLEQVAAELLALSECGA